MMNKVLGFLGLNDDEDQQEKDGRPADEAVQTPEVRKNNKASVLAIHSQKSARVVLHEPRSYDEVQDIADHLRQRRSVIVNLQRVRQDHMIRIVDFLSGTVYALGGSIQKIGNQIFFCAPDGVEVMGTISELFSGEAAQSSTSK
jgi:cell division inhibitor SepF